MTGRKCASAARSKDYRGFVRFGRGNVCSQGWTNELIRTDIVICCEAGRPFLYDGFGRGWVLAHDTLQWHIPYQVRHVFSRIHRINAMPHRLDSTQPDTQNGDFVTLHALALAIADHAARSEIELYSLQTIESDGRRVFDTQRPREESVGQESLSIAAKAARYIEQRGSALPYRLRRSGSLVWFEETDAAVPLAG
jgi:hypothetical protein